jgi:hypothetical protein
MNRNLQVWLARWEQGGGEPVLVSSLRDVRDGSTALLAAGMVVRKLGKNATGLHATNAVVGGAEGVLVYLVDSPWAAFVPRLRLRGEEQARPNGIHVHGDATAADAYC